MFLALLWRTGAFRTAHPQTMSLFVSSLGAKMAAGDPTVKTLGRDILNALSALETVVPGSLSKGKGLNCTGIWLASLSSDPEDFLDACMWLVEADFFADGLVQLRSPTFWSCPWVPKNGTLSWSWRFGITCGTVCCSS